ncbi:MAG: transglutaminase family protein, partial [Rhodocyclaceae bacterium]|nr:transglutaminase family protein [Rhodocyclaceae bacterium]
NRTDEFRIEVDLVAEMKVINPFDFFLEPYAEKIPFDYEKSLLPELAPYLVKLPATPKLQGYLDRIDRTPRRAVDFLVGLNQMLWKDISYLIRLEPGVQTPEETLEKGSGSCRDSAWLMVQLLRHLGLAARFASGYLIQLTADVKALDGPSGPEADFTDLHAWCEVFLPGAGWVGLDPTSGLFAGEGHIPLACSPEPSSAAPITGLIEKCEVEFTHVMKVERVHEVSRVTKPYTEEQWESIESLGHLVDADLRERDVRLTMGGEPTFVSIDDRDGAEWNTEAMGPNKRKLGVSLLEKLKGRYAPDGLLHFGQGKWYPGEQLPRWSLTCFWRKDGEPIWTHPELFANERENHGANAETAGNFLKTLARKLRVDGNYVFPAYEDAWYYLWRERRLPVNVDPFDARLDDPLERDRLRKVFTQGLDQTIGYVFPIKRNYYGAARWQTGPWFLRAERCYLIPGDSPIGYRLPLDSQPWAAPVDYPWVSQPDLTQNFAPLPSHREIASLFKLPFDPKRAAELGYSDTAMRGAYGDYDEDDQSAWAGREGGEGGEGGDGGAGEGPEARRRKQRAPLAQPELPAHLREFADADAQPGFQQSAGWITRTAMCAEPRNGVLYIFMPPTECLEDYLELVTAIEATAVELGMPVVLEGYEPPRDPRLENVRITPDPGVLEVNVQPVDSWDKLVSNTSFLYDSAFQSRLSTEKFMLDGRHVGTGGGNHFVLGGATVQDSPFLRRPDLLASLVSYWHNHPSLSYLFSGMFIGPTSQHPRFDEARHESVYEIEIAMRELKRLTSDGPTSCPPWMIDRVLRNLLVDVTGNTHRTEFCIDKLYSPDGPTGRLGLLELRAFEMPPHARMSLAQQLLLRSLISRFWRHPYEPTRLKRWGTEVHDRFLLPHFVWNDLQDVVLEMQDFGYPMQLDWFEPHFEFRFPLLGDFASMNVAVELRSALEPWNVMGEQGAIGGTVRYVDSSVERVQVKVQGLVGDRHVLAVNGRRVPLHPTGTNGEYVAGIRYRAWQPPSCLHPTIPTHNPLIFDLVDTWMSRSMGGCQYHVMHPGGVNYETFPVNAFEAESRRLSRFFRIGHTPGRVEAPPEERSPDYPFTLDLRRARV